MDDTQTKESLLVTIRELGRQNDELRRRFDAMMRRPKGSRFVTACLGFSTVTILRQSQEIVASHPQVIFQPERVCVSRECAGHFLIEDLKVGMRSQFIAPGAIPARMFAVENVHRYREIECDEDFETPLPIVFDTCMPGMLVTLVVRRIDDSTIPFECCIVGSTTDDFRENAFPEGPVSLPKSKN